jgi:hypothetical protein
MRENRQLYGVFTSGQWAVGSGQWAVDGVDGPDRDNGPLIPVHWPLATGHCPLVQAQPSSVSRASEMPK